MRELTVEQAVEDGDRRAVLDAMRLRIARAIDDEKTPPRDLAALTRRQMEIEREIESIDVQAEEEHADDELAPEEEFDPDEL